MKASELRIGNFFILPNGEIGKITYHEIRLLTISTEKPNYKPISLTEEWLLKFGFEKGNFNWFRLYFKPNNLDDSDCFTYNLNSKMLCLECFYGGEKKDSIQLLGLNEKYVHQLQNLYFALTNEELTYEQQK